MEQDPNIQAQIQSAIANERKAASKQQTKLALIGVFVIIPAIVFAVVAVWFINRIMQGG